MKIWGAIVALLLGACAGPVPQCVEERPGRVWPAAICGDPADTIARGGRSFVQHGDGTWSLFAAVCTDDWAATCDGDRTTPPLNLGHPTYCAEVDAPPTCENGEVPRCISVPCDGNTYYGPAHPMAGE